MIITEQWLLDRGACRIARNSFQLVFGESAELNEYNLAKASDAMLNLIWLADKLMTSDNFRWFITKRSFINSEYITDKNMISNSRDPDRYQLYRDLDHKYDLDIAKLFMYHLEEQNGVHESNP